MHEPADQKARHLCCWVATETYVVQAGMVLTVADVETILTCCYRGKSGAELGRRKQVETGVAREPSR